MPTRSNIKIVYGGTELYLYRHCDGYPAVNGVDLCKALLSEKGPSAFVSTLLAQGEESRYADKGFRHDYEVTCGWHGDIEWAYVITFDTSAPYKMPAVAYAKIGFGFDRETILGRLDDESKLVFSELSVDEFSAYCRDAERMMEFAQARLGAAGCTKAVR